MIFSVGSSITIDFTFILSPDITLIKSSLMLVLFIFARLTPSNSLIPVTLTSCISKEKYGKELNRVKSKSPKSTFALTELLISVLKTSTNLSLKINGNEISVINSNKKTIPDHLRIFFILLFFFTFVA